jgi:cellobiose-specific phosphotransferase system component IIA
MNTIKLIIISSVALVVGCAAPKQERYIAPSAVAVKVGVERLKPHITTSAGNAAIKDVISAIDTYEEQVDKQSQDLSEAQNNIVYWHGKHEKALRELWTWRMIALSGILCVVVYIGLKTAWRFRP